MMSSRTISLITGEKSSYLFFYNTTRIYMDVYIVVVNTACDGPHLVERLRLEKDHFRLGP